MDVFPCEDAYAEERALLPPRWLPYNLARSSFWPGRKAAIVNIFKILILNVLFLCLERAALTSLHQRVVASSGYTALALREPNGCFVVYASQDKPSLIAQHFKWR